MRLLLQVRKGVRLVNNVGNVPKIVGDTGRIVQILYNLVGNAGGWPALYGMANL